MIDFEFSQFCCGCMSCFNSCPVGAIKMLQDEEGFLMPNIDKKRCIDCGKCEKSCPHLNITEDSSIFTIDDFKDKKAYLYFSKSKRRKDSASGGFVYDTMEACIGNGGVACGCVWNDDMKAVHIVSDKQYDLYRMQSSKYVQSEIGECFKLIKAELKKGRKVVFCGTPCQTAGLHFFLGKNKNRDNLFSICLICHGVPSPGVWDRWKKIMERKNEGIIVDVNMRDKTYKGYKMSYVRYSFSSPSHKNNQIDIQHTSQITRNVGMPTYLADKYIFLFTDNLYLRHCCSHCKYKANNNEADIIVGDFYASTIEAGNDGCSCLIAMTNKGENFISNMKGYVKAVNYEDVCGVNPMLWESVKEGSRRNEFFTRYKAGDDSEKLFDDFLPMRFKIKKLLNEIGLFQIAKKLIKR